MKFYPKTTKRIRNGLTLLELLVVIVIVSILMGLLFPAIQMSRAASRRLSCSNKMRQISLGIHHFESARKKLPQGIMPFDDSEFGSMSFLTRTLPFVEQISLWDQATKDYAIDGNPFNSHSNLRTPVALFSCPSDSRSIAPNYTHNFKLVATTSYLGVNGIDYLSEDGLFFKNSKVRFADITDGLSYTLMLGERPPSPDHWYGWWYAGFGQHGSGSPDMLLGVREVNQNPGGGQNWYLEDCGEGPFSFEKGRGEMCDTLHFWSRHVAGSNFAFADGSVHFFSYDSAKVLTSLATRNGGEVSEFPF